jgi:hypothetical protein
MIRRLDSPEPAASRDDDPADPEGVEWGIEGGELDGEDEPGDVPPPALPSVPLFEDEDPPAFEVDVLDIGALDPLQEDEEAPFELPTLPGLPGLDDEPTSDDAPIEGWAFPEEDSGDDGIALPPPGLFDEDGGQPVQEPSKKV